MKSMGNTNRFGGNVDRVILSIFPQMSGVIEWRDEEQMELLIFQKWRKREKISQLKCGEKDTP